MRMANISAKGHNLSDPSVLSSSVCFQDQESADRFYEVYIAWCESNKPPVPITICRGDTSAMYPNFVTRFFNREDNQRQGDWFYEFYEYGKELSKKGELQWYRDSASGLPATQLLAPDYVKVVKCTYIEP
jgi:hypothetical protein